MNKFQLVLTAVFGVFIVLGVIVFSAYKGSSKDQVTVVVWGTLPQAEFDSIVQSTSLSKSKEVSLQYFEKPEASFDAEFVEALASGKGPDLFLLPSDKVLKHRNKIFAIPYNVYTQRQFKDAFVEGAEIYMAPEGILALPIWADPLVMYWNRSLFNAASLTQPPKYWDEFYELSEALTKKDGALNVSQSAVAMGEYANVAHAKDIVANLAMQAGTPMVDWQNGSLFVVFANNFNKPTVPAEAAVNFYTEFSNPAKPSYSWNRSLPNSTSSFLSGTLAMYFGFASEISSLQIKNPNLNFDAAPMPSSREGGTNEAFTEFYGFAIVKSSKNPNAALIAASALSSSEGSAAFAKALNLPPARRDLLSKRQSDSYLSVFYDSAIRGRAWLDPSPADSGPIFKTMIESITSGRSRTSEAVLRASRELDSLIAK